MARFRGLLFTVVCCSVVIEVCCITVEEFYTFGEGSGDSRLFRNNDGSSEAMDVMRRYFLANAGRRGYEAIDMQPRFIAHYREHGRRFEWPRDEHWNALGHERCFEAVAGSELLAVGFPAR